MPTVYHIQHTGRRDKSTGAFMPHDITAAMRFGEVVTLLPAEGGDPALAPGSMVDHLERRMRDYNSDDYILPMGSPAALVAAGVIAWRNSQGPLNVLIWDARSREYYVSRLDIGDV